MKILLTGANGFLGYYLTKLFLENNHTVIATGKGPCRMEWNHPDFKYEEMDLTHKEMVNHILLKYAPAHIVHAGAISKPDDCELEKDLAFGINVTGTINLLEASALFSSHFIFISTDFVFDGVKGMYHETDIPNPVNYYGLTKLLAEKEVQQLSNNWSIVRTVMVYGKPVSGRHNLLTLVREKLMEGESYSVFSDQVRTPTYVEDLAAAILLIIEKDSSGIFHISGKDVLTPYDMALAVANFLNLDAGLIKEVSAKIFQQAATRPLKTGFDISKAKKELGYEPASFAQGLALTFRD